jgi:phosphoribosylamine--glycine ligase
MNKRTNLSKINAMKILLIGSGGRESAIAWKLSQSTKVTTIYVTPGNAGTENAKKCCNVSLHSINEYLMFAKDNKIDLTIVGPEQPLVEGIVDLFQKNKLNIFGPNHQAAMLEGSKIFSKNFMQQYGVATASYNSFTSPFAASAYIKNAKFPLVIKANGLAAGKGVEICKNFKEAQNTITKFMIDGAFKEASKSIVIEEFLKGTEASIICITDGKSMIPLVSAQDHKTIFDDNKGPNTGGMGAVAPNPHVTKEVMKDFVNNIMNPTLLGIKKEKFNFHGFIFFGIMITKDGCKCLEYNVRMGDPECQSIVPLMDFDLYQLFMDTLKDKLSNFKFK